MNKCFDSIVKYTSILLSRPAGLHTSARRRHLTSVGIFFARRTRMKYERSAKTCEQQADLILSRGLVADRNDLIAVLTQIIYYRLSTYLYTFRDGTDIFLPGTSLHVIRRLYELEHELWILLIDIIEGIETLVRSKLAYFFALKQGAFACIDPKLFKKRGA